MTGPLKASHTPDPREGFSSWVEVNLDAVAANVARIRAALRPTCQLMAVVKADAYGHGAVEIARAALEAGAKAVGVALVEEGLQLMAAQLKAPIHILGGVAPAQLAKVVEAGFIQSISDAGTAQTLSDLAQARACRVPVAVKVDTGLTRFGVPWKDAPGFIRMISRLPGLKLEEVYTHFADAEDPDDSFTQEQLVRFHSVLRSLEALPALHLRGHVAGSAALLQWPEAQFDMVRPGLLVLGIFPSPKLRRTIAVTPVSRVLARVAQHRTVPAGTPVGYGGTYVAPQTRRVATILIGYGDGYPRVLANRAVARVRGIPCPVIGSVMLTHLTLDVTGVDEISAGDEVELIGTSREAGNSIEALASVADTVVDELCLVGRHLPHIYLRGGQPTRVSVGCRG